MKENPKSSASEQTSELLILGDGNIFAHNLTPAMAELLAGLNPNDTAMRQRAKLGVEAPVSLRKMNLDRHSSRS